MPNISEIVANIFITISGFFIDYMGMGFTEYLNDYRLTMAAKLLKSSDESILILVGPVALITCLILIAFSKEKMVFRPEFIEKHRSCRELLVND